MVESHKNQQPNDTLCHTSSLWSVTRNRLHQTMHGDCRRAILESVPLQHRHLRERADRLPPLRRVHDRLSATVIGMRSGAHKARNAMSATAAGHRATASALASWKIAAMLSG